jgi:hypothetical protein
MNIEMIMHFGLVFLTNTFLHKFKLVQFSFANIARIMHIILISKFNLLLNEAAYEIKLNEATYKYSSSCFLLSFT